MKSSFALGSGILLSQRPGSPKIELSTSAVPLCRRPRERNAPNSVDYADIILDESVESVSEARTRNIIGTVDQKKPKPSPSRTNVAECLRRHNTQKMNETLFDAFGYARGWYGELVLEAKLGRLVFFNLPRNIVKQDIEWQQWDELMASSETTFKTTFTKILTTQHFDVEFLRDLKLGGGERLFNEVPISRRVTYEFELDQKNVKRILSMDGETFMPTLYGELKNISAVNIANPLRSWDFRIDLIGKKVLDINNHPSIKAIFDSITCSGENGRPDLTFTLHAPCLSVRRILVKCETRHTVILERLQCGVPMQLVMTEVQELHISKNKNIDKEYRAFAKAKNDMRREARLHWTCSVVPIEVNALLKQNLKLEVGETANWSAEEVLRLQEQAGGMLLPSMVNVLSQIVSKIDDVGSTNIAFV